MNLSTENTKAVRTTNGFKIVAEQKDVGGKLDMIIELLGTANFLHRAKAKGEDVLKFCREYIDSNITAAIAKTEPKPECARGCSHCCHQVVSVSTEEADDLIKFVTPD